jgi:hypothetical protein
MAAVARTDERLAPAEPGQLAQTWRRFKKHRLGLTGLVTITLLVVSVIVIPMLSPFAYDELDPEALVPDSRPGRGLEANFAYKPAMWDAPLSGKMHYLGTGATTSHACSRAAAFRSWWA